MQTDRLQKGNQRQGVIVFDETQKLTKRTWFWRPATLHLNGESPPVTKANYEAQDEQAILNVSSVVALNERIGQGQVHSVSETEQ